MGVWGDPEVLRWVRDEPLADVREAASLLSVVLREGTRADRFVWAVQTADGLVGTALLDPAPGELTGWEASAHLARAAQGAGLGSEVLGAVLAFASRTGRAPTWMLVDPANPAGLGVARRLGVDRGLAEPRGVRVRCFEATRGPRGIYSDRPWAY